MKPRQLVDRPTRWVRRWLTDERLNSDRFTLGVWFASRVLVLLVWTFLAPNTQGDVYYYFDKLEAMGNVGPGFTLVEYPTPVIWLLSIPHLISRSHPVIYVTAFALIMLALDAGFSWSLWRHGGRLRGAAVIFWTFFLLVEGPTSYLRFDLIPAILGGWALLNLLARRHTLAGALVGLGAAVKLWPALMWPALLADRGRPRRLASLGFWVTGVALAAASLIWAGWTRLLSPLTWQSQRGLQVESVWATPVMLARAVHRAPWIVEISDWQAFEIIGPGVSLMLLLSKLATALGILAALAACAMWLRRGHGRPIEATALMLLVVAMMIVTNKTFSPQYIIWLGGPVAAGYAIVAQTPAGTPRARRDEQRLFLVAKILLLVTAVTQLIYPIGYSPLVRPGVGITRFEMVVVTGLLAVRNVGVCYLLWLVARWVWQFVRPGGDELPDGERA